MHLIISISKLSCVQTQKIIVLVECRLHTAGQPFKEHDILYNLVTSKKWGKALAMLLSSKVDLVNTGF